MRFKHATLCGIVGGLLLGFASIKSAKAPLIEFETHYREKAKNTITLVMNYGGMPMLNTLYEVDGDGMYDVSELRMIRGVDENGIIKTEIEPLIYGFDLNKDGVFDEGETLVDEAMDGINGNEVLLNDYGVEKKELSGGIKI